ncbi:hypothetical protein PPYR_10603 [Photinus pyralis]|uniref:FAD dependent oxidoreductase domain-containing protein n=1 Tax=Photinus pyralis TaxID=7054 RepID=A0A5N4AGR4_PHOPY|nr:D-aspartate oxidase [Photinus pyralis]XP_031348666.1 D-aspartate oxidase [Photinus pyralis]KAB0796542.1 hypothetical protein PPYR_10603 [Photinus pyralis]
MADINIAVVGAGVVGLTTALELQSQFRNAKVTVIADKFQQDTTSFVAAGLFRPSPSFAGPNQDITRKWINNSYYHWDAIRKIAEAPLVGVTEISGYMFSKVSASVVRNPYLEGLVPLYRSATREEFDLCPGDWKYGSFFTTLLVDCGVYLPWATKKYLSENGQVVRQSVNAFGEFAGKYDVVVNCTGFGAKNLCNDNRLIPIRGQVLKVHAPWLKTFFYGEYDTYVIPSFGDVTLGGCRQYESYNTEPCKYDTLSIRERCESMLPSLKTAPLLGQRVGLRPHRDVVRVEKEILTTERGPLKVVHNYGHGGYGVTTAPGTSKYAVELVREMLMGNSKL